MLTGPSPAGCEKPGAQRDAAPSPGDRHPLLGPPGSQSAPDRCKAWPLHRGPPVPQSGFPTHGDSRPPPARCPPQPGRRDAPLPSGTGWDWWRAGGRATRSSGQLAPRMPGPILPSEKAGGGDHCPRAPREGQGIVFEAQRERAGPSAWPTTPRWQSLQGCETVPHPSQPSDRGKGFQGPGRQDSRAQGIQRDLLLSGGQSLTVRP